MHGAGREAGHSTRPDLVMGRTIPTATQQIFDLDDDMEPFYYAVKEVDQNELDKMFETIVEYRDAISNTGTMYPLEVILISMALAEHKRSEVLIQGLSNRLDSLTRAVTMLSGGRLIIGEG